MSDIKQIKKDVAIALLKEAWDSMDHARSMAVQAGMNESLAQEFAEEAQEAIVRFKDKVLEVKGKES